MRYEIRFAGSGGQGVILAALIAGEAAALFEEGLYVVQSQSYGPEARGGKSKAEVVISTEPVDYPKAVSPLILHPSISSSKSRVPGSGLKLELVKMSLL